MNLPLVYLALAPALVTDLYLDEQLEQLAGSARIERWQEPTRPSAEAISAALERAQVIISGWGTPSLAAWSPEASATRLVAHTAGTVKQLVTAQAIEQGLLVTHANESLAEAVAEFTLGAIIMGRRRAFAAAERFRARRPNLPLSSQHEVQGGSVGIVGASAVGRRVLEMLAVLRVELLLYDPYCPPHIAAAFNAQQVELHELLRRSDVVSLHAPVTPETIGMFGANEFAQMRDGALLVNTARGKLLDHDALLAELQTGRISALLDVTDPTEPLPVDSPFFTLENCTVLPHMAAVTVQARRRQGKYMVDEVLRFLRGESLKFQVSHARWDTMA